jgi:ParB family chromosome partitioning protein
MNRKRGLGRGLDALLPAGAPLNPITEMGVQQVAITAIERNPRQPRLTLHAPELDELVASIREHGIIQPLVVARTAQSAVYVLVAGQRRLEAAKRAGLDSVPAVIRDQTTDQELLELALIENVQRSDLSPFEAALAYQSLHEDFSLSHEEIAQRVGKRRVTITNTLRLLKLIPELQQALANQEISEGHARALLGLTTAAAQLAALQTVLNKQLNVRQTEDLVRKLNGTRPEKPVPTVTRSAEEIDLENRLRDKLGTKVRLRCTPQGAGVLNIHFYSDEELHLLIERFLED